MQPAPQFKTVAVVNGEFREVSLDSFKGQYLVLVFYPYDFTIRCPGELVSYSERVDDFKALKAQLAVCSTDSPYAHLAWSNARTSKGLCQGPGPVRMPMLSDRTLTISRTYGVLDEKTGNAYRALFIIDGKGVLRHVSINDPKINRSADETLRLLKAFKTLDEYGEQCLKRAGPTGPKQPPCKIETICTPRDGESCRSVSGERGTPRREKKKSPKKSKSKDGGGGSCKPECRQDFSEEPAFSTESCPKCLEGHGYSYE